VRFVAGALAVGLAAVCGLLVGPGEAGGVLLGSGLTLLNFGGLTWAADRALASGGPAGRRTVWIGASGLRLAVLACLTGLAVGQGGVGLAGLLLSLVLVPVAVILVGLRAARAV
jgi:hypothetical protein